METLLEALENTCPACGRGSNLDRHFWKQQTRVIEYPEVLVLVLNRWNTPYGASLHTVRANESIYFQGRRYALVSTVCHLGPSPHAGHYIAVARHGSAAGDWWVYDDDMCTLAEPPEVSAESANYRQLGHMQSYILLYSKAYEAVSS